MAPLLRAPSSLAGRVLDMERASASTVGGFNKFMIFDDENMFYKIEQIIIGASICINLLNSHIKIIMKFIMKKSSFLQVFLWGQ